MYFCKPFFSETYIKTIQNLPVFASGGMPYYPLGKPQSIFADQIFQKIKIESESDYVFRLDLIRTYVIALIHFATKIQCALNSDLSEMHNVNRWQPDTN
jgi:AraC family transcriptional activator of pobA